MMSRPSLRGLEVSRRRVLRGLAGGAVGLAAALAAGRATAQEPPLVDVALDPGHSRADVGASGGGMGEYQVTLDLAYRTRACLEAAGFTVRLTREDHEPLTSLRHPDPTEAIRIEQDARIWAGWPARIYVSLHFNGGPATLRGTETYFNPERAEDAAVADSSLARSLQREVLAVLNELGYASPDRGAKSDLTAGKPYGHFFSLRGPMPSALAESLFLSNPGEAALLWEDGTRDALARGLTAGIASFFAEPA